MKDTSSTQFPSSNPISILKDSITIWWDAWTDWIAIGTIWVLCWIIFALGPPATFGLYYVAAELKEGRAIGVRGFVQGGKEYFWRSWIWMLVFVLVGIVIIANYIFYGQVDASWTDVVRGVLIFLGILWISLQFFAIPYFMLQEEQSLRLAWKNAFLTAIASPFHAIIIFFISILLLILSVMFFVPLFLGVPGLVAVLGYLTVENRVHVFGVREREDVGRH